VEERDTPAVSVLFPVPGTALTPPDDLDRDALADLNLDQLVAALARRRPSYDLAPLFTRRLGDPAVVAYRQEVFRDLEDGAVTGVVTDFTAAMQRVRRFRSLARERQAADERRSWTLQAGRAYLQAVTDLARGLAGVELGSRGLLGLREHLTVLLTSDAFQRLVRTTTEVADGLAAVHYRLHLAGASIEVSHDDPTDGDYTSAVATLFARFRQDEGPPPRRSRAVSGLNHLEAEILDRVAALHPEAFDALDRYAAAYPDPVDPTVAAFDRDVQFYLAYLEFLTPLRKAGLSFCEPDVALGRKTIDARGVFDLVLADALISRGGGVVPNDVRLDGPERVLVVTGANQGGKTTFARAVGQLLHLAALGCPVPATTARLPLPERILTHFARGEQLDDRRGRLQDDLLRIRAVLAAATPDSVIIVNELFRSTTLADATDLGRRIVERLLDADLLTVFVTFIDELSMLGPGTVSLVATVDPRDPAVRTFRVVRAPADGRAHAAAIARKHRLTFEQLTERLAP
jgi:DNA mismatch repair protein MutS